MNRFRDAILAFILITFTLSINLSVASDDLVARIAFFNYMFERLNGPSYSPADGGIVQIQEAMAPLAAIIFNERRAEIIPALGNLTSCNKNISIEWVCR
jgi:hypothetical protein